MPRFEGILLIVLTLVAAVVGSALPQLLGQSGNVVISNSDAATVTRRIDVAGSGVVYAVPDQATVQIGVSSQAESASDALTDNSGKTAAVIETIKSLGVDEKDIQTRDFSIYPTYDQATNTKITGYQVTNAVVVIIRDVKNAGAILDQVVQSGANNISGLSFDVADPTAQQAEARTKAVAVARAKAETLAAAAGVSLGEIISINESVSSSGPIMPYARADMAMADAVPVATGQQAITVDVSISFAIR